MILNSNPGRQLDTKEISPVNFSLIDPLSKRKTIQKKILLGSFQLRQAKSYLSELTINENVYIVIFDIIEKKLDKIFSKNKGNKNNFSIAAFAT